MSDELEPVNIGNPNEMSILDFAKKVVELTNSQSEIIFIEPTDERIQDDPKVRCPDISKARRVLGWEPKVSIDNGLSNTIEYFRNAI